jgi:hypothetical protein
VLFPKAGPHESKWEAIINHNIGMEYRGIAMDLLLPPVIGGMVGAGMGALDVLTLGLLGFSKNYNDQRKEIVERIMKELKFRYVDSQKEIVIIGVPGQSMAPEYQKGDAPKRTLAKKEGAAYQGFRGSLDVGDYGEDFNSGRYPVMDFSDGKGRVYRGKAIDNLVKKRTNSEF